jgi:hypothetical protein
MEQLPEAEQRIGHDSDPVKPPHPFYAPNYDALQNDLVYYERVASEERIASQVERQARDRLIATWRDILHMELKQVGPIDPRGIHKVIDAMDNFLNRAGGKRK